MADPRPLGPRAIRLDAGAETVTTQRARTVTVVPETEPVDPPAADEDAPKRQRGIGWATVQGKTRQGRRGQRVNQTFASWWTA